MKKLKILSEGNTLYQNHRDEPYFTYMKEGKKTIEGRLSKGLYAEVTSGDYIEVQNLTESDSVVVKVVAVRNYDSFMDMLTHEDIYSVLPNISDVTGGVAVYEQFYTKEQQEAYGVVALKVKRIDG